MITRSTLAALAIVVLFPVLVYATGQASDVVIYDGKKRALFANPLESFYENSSDRPRFQVRPNTMSSGNWRGYVATWEISDGALYLVDIDSWICASFRRTDCNKANVATLFGKRVRKGRVKADWFTGELRIPDGKQLQYVHMGYGSVYERDIIVTINSGKIVGTSTQHNAISPLPSELELQRRELEKLKPKSN